MEKKNECAATMQDVKLELVKLRRHGHTLRVTQTLRWGRGLKLRFGG